MKVYSQLIDLSKVSPQTFWVAPNSSFKLGVKLVQETTFKVLDGDVELESDGEIDGFTTYSIESTTPGMKDYVVEAENGQKVVVKQVTTDSTVFEVGGDGGSIPEGNFVKSVNGELPVNSNIDVDKLAYTNDDEEEAWITGKTIADSLNNIDEQLEKKADIDDVNDKINQFAAHYLTKMNGSQFATHAELATAKQALIDDPDTPQFKYGDDAHVPDKNDYLIVVADELHNGKTTRYAFVGDWPTGFFRYQYTINDTTFTPAQLDALNSGVKSENTMTLAGEYEDGTTFSYTVYTKNA